MFGTALPNNSPHSADNGPINAQKEERLQDRKRAAITLKQLRDLPLQLPVYEPAFAGLSTEGTAGYSLAVTYPSRISPTSIFPEALQEELQLKELIGYPQIQRAVELNDEFEPQSLDYEVNIMTQEDLEKLIRQYELQYGITSEEFLRRWNEGTMPDTFETNDWAILLDYL